MSSIVPAVEPGLITMPAAVSSAGDLVISKFEEARTYSASLWGTAISAIETLKNMTFSVELPGIDVEPIPLMGLDGIDLTIPGRPTVAITAVDWPEFNAAEPNSYGIDLPIVAIPGFNVPDPGIVIPSPPDVVWPTLDANPPSIGDPEIPTKPAVTLPTLPVLNFASIPAPPEYSIPAFTATEPVDNLEPPSPTFVWTEAEYNSALLSQLRTKVYNDLIAGGSGLNAATEQAIYDRAITRQELENQKIYDDALNYFASRGCPMPPGALSGILIEADYKIAQMREDINNDILVQQSKLAQENTHFIISAATALEKMGMDYTNAMQTRAFEAAQYAVEAAIKIFMMRVESYKARIEIYRVLAEVYRTRILAETAKAELYRAQIDAVQAHTEIQKAYVQLYVAQLQGVQALYDAYRTEMEGANIRASIDRTRIESYTSLVNAYATRVKAVTARYEGYQAHISGELAKAEVYKAQVAAYNVRIEALATAAKVDVSRAQVQLARTEAETEVYKTKILKYNADVEAKKAEIDAAVKIEGLDVEVYKAESVQYTSELEALARVFASRVQEVASKYNIEVEELKTIANTAMAKYGLMVEAEKGVAQVASQLGAAAFAGVSASAHIGHGESRSDSRAYQASNSYSGQEAVSVSFNNNYNHED